jgi:hypothetical protein
MRIDGYGRPPKGPADIIVDGNHIVAVDKAGRR